jgi:hypothetical protein
MSYIHNFCHADIIEYVWRTTSGGKDVIERHRLLKAHPVRCGILAFHIMSQWREISISVANHSNLVTAAGHLLNVIEREGLLVEPWMDMNILFTTQGETHVFAGERPTSGDQYHRRFSVAVLGHSVTNFASNRRNAHLVVTRSSGPRKLHSLAAITTMFSQLYCRNPQSADLSVLDIEKIIELSNLSVGRATTEGEHGQQGTTIKPLLRRQKKTTAKSLRSSKPVKLPELLAALVTAIGMERVETLFDYSLMHRLCWAFLGSLKDVYREKLPG